MGVTYRAADRVLHRQVALKVIDVAGRAAQVEALRERFLREARAAAALRHRNIAGVFQFGAVHDSGCCYYAMELVEGETLEARVRRDGPLDASTALEVARQVCAALVAAADRGLIHRDLKPGNLMLTTGGSPAELEVKMIDFGLAKAAAAIGEADLTHGGFVGTPAFASPEQFARETVDARSDLYSLGITLWYTLTGRVPFVGRTLEELRDHPGRAKLPVEQLTAHAVPPCVIALLCRALAVDPAARPDSARELLNALDACRQQLSATRAPSATRRRLARAAVGILMLAAAGTFWWRVAFPASTPAAPLPPEKSVAVLPFDSLSADKENAFFTDGVQDEILADLAKLADLKVISRTSVLPYKSGTPRNLREITRELGVAHIVEGSVQRSGNRVRVTAQLIDGRTDAHEWAEHYDRDISDVFTIQSEIAEAIAAQLQARLSPGEKAAIDAQPTANLAAHDAYLVGMKLLHDSDAVGEAMGLAEAVHQLEEATSRDPQFFLAWCELARADLYVYWNELDHTPARRARAESALQTARHLRPDAGEIHLVEGLLRYWGYRDYPAAITELQTAARLLPNDPRASRWLGAVLRRQDRREESIPHFEHAVALDPRNPVNWMDLATTEQSMFRYAEAGRAIDHAIALDPGNLDYLESRAWLARNERADLEPFRQWLRSVPEDSDLWSNEAGFVAIVVALESSDYPAAVRALSRYQEPTWGNENFSWPRARLEGEIALLHGDRSAANNAFLAARQIAQEAVTKKPQDPKALMVLAMLDAYLGRKEDAIREGEQAQAMQRMVEDAVGGPYMTDVLAVVYAQAGARDQAIDTLHSIVGKPAGPSYGYLRLFHGWDPLRGDPRFDAMVASIAPKPGR